MTATGTSFARPARSALLTRAQNDLNGRIPGADSRLRRSFLGGVAAMHAGACDALYGALQTVALNVIPDTADLAHLTRWAAMFGITPAAPTAGVGTAASTGACVNGTDVPSGTVLARSDQFDYVTTADATVADGVVTCPVAASAPGSIGSAEVGVVLNLATPIAGVSSAFAVTGADIVGTDAETPEALLAQVLARMQRPPMGGGPGDYAAWALDGTVPGVTRAWERPLWMGLGTVGLFFVFDGREDIFPLDADVTAMQTYLDSVAPETAVVYALAPTPLAVAFTIEIAPNTAPVQAAIQAELADLFTTLGAPGAGISAFQYNQAISDAEGVTDAIVTAPAGAITPTAYELPTLGAITWEPV
jgi:uncharacterized phage protein gp47/JayE